MDKTINIGYLTKYVLDTMRELMQNGGIVRGDNSYFWVQYKDGSIFVLDQSWGGEKPPSMNMNDMLFVETWFYPYAELYINPRLGWKTTKQILKDSLYDEDGCLYYQYIDINRDFPDFQLIDL